MYWRLSGWVNPVKNTIAILLAASIAAVSQSGVDSIFAPLVDAKSPGVAAMVRKDGHTVLSKGYGDAIDSKTNFRLASFTKQFTAMAIMLLVHDGKLRYDEPLTEIFPDFPAYGREITVRQLLTHTSGLPDYEDLMSDSAWTASHQIQDGEVLQLLKQQTKPTFSPGSKWAYSNSGYVVLGLIVAKVSGKPFGQFLHDRIFQPLHMNHTVLFVNGSNSVSNRALGHSRKGDAFIETDQSSTSATQGDGGVYSNLEDLAKWDDALDKHTLLSHLEMKPALTPVRVNDPVSYGFGWFLDAYEGHARMYHTGTTTGFRTVIERFTAEKLTVILLANRADLDVSALALKVAEPYLNKH